MIHTRRFFEKRYDQDMRRIKNGIRSKIKALKTMKRFSVYTGEEMGWTVGDIDVAYVNKKTKEAEINWG